jgi:quercetin dioxygenase-like cupin family protein
MAVAMALAGCTARAPQLTVGSVAAGLDRFLTAHPLVPGQELRVDPVDRTEGASYHLVQVRGGEKPHRHAAHDLTVLVLRGRGTLHAGGEVVALAAGDVIVIPRDAVHWFSNTGREPAVALVVFTPPLDAPDSVPAGSVDSPADGR